ncbi:MAG TPA: SDR family oxidoreductase [Dehalococcoidia bacterium]|nr:SDR family oxidoreductase [Dehalococcoidia bacterium]
MKQLENKIAIITGAGSGIGRAIALGLAEEGASVTVSDINSETAAAVAAEIGNAALANTCDVSDPDQVEAMVAATIERFGRVDILVNNAGYAWGGPLARIDVEEWDKVFATNVRGTFLCSKAVLQHMIPQRSGAIVNTTSGTAMNPRPYISPYGASKAAVSYVTQALATEVARYGIRVNAFTPGVTDTPFWRRFRSEEDIKAAYDAGEVGQPEDLVSTVVFLCSDTSREISGAIVPRQIFVAKGEQQ